MGKGDYHAPTIVSGKLTASTSPSGYGRFRAEPPRPRTPYLLSEPTSAAVQNSPSSGPPKTLILGGAKGFLLIPQLGSPQTLCLLGPSYVLEDACIVEELTQSSVTMPYPAAALPALVLEPNRTARSGAATRRRRGVTRLRLASPILELTLPAFSHTRRALARSPVPGSRAVLCYVVVAEPASRASLPSNR